MLTVFDIQLSYFPTLETSWIHGVSHSLVTIVALGCLVAGSPYEMQGWRTAYATRIVTPSSLSVFLQPALHILQCVIRKSLLSPNPCLLPSCISFDQTSIRTSIVCRLDESD